MTIRGGAVGASLKARRCEGEKSLLLGHRDSLVHPSRTRNAECVAALEDRSPAIAGLPSKPSGGLEPPTPSLPWRFRSVTRVHARSLTTRFLLQIGLVGTLKVLREASRVSFLMCPFCVRRLVPDEATKPARGSQCRLWRVVLARQTRFEGLAIRGDSSVVRPPTR
jgi:hypothetical protein